MKTQSISLRLAPGSGTDGLWSSPIPASLTGGAAQHLAIPYRESSPPEDSSHLHGPRVHRVTQQTLGYDTLLASNSDPWYLRLVHNVLSSSTVECQRQHLCKLFYVIVLLLVSEM